MNVSSHHSSLIGFLRRRRVRELEQALEMMLVAFRSHDRWCGYRAEAHGDGVLNEAVRMAERALGRG